MNAMLLQKNLALLLWVLLPILSLQQQSSSALPISTSAATQSLPIIVRQTMHLHFASANTAGRFPLLSYITGLKVEPKFKKPAGVFVTLSKSGKTRACWGSIIPQQQSIAAEVVYSTLGALTKEYRYPPIREHEIDKLHIQVTIIKSVEPVNNVLAINPFRDGLMVRCGGKSGVILPGEATSAYHQMILAKLKAGIKPKESCTIYRLRTEIYE